LAARVAEEAKAVSAQTVLVCGTVEEDHGEQVAAELAAALAAEGRNVAVVELDPSRPALRRQFALERSPGASEFARGETTLEAALSPVPGASGLAVVSAGAQDPAEALASAAVLGALRQRFELIVVAGPPLISDGGDALPPADALLLAVDLHRMRRSRRPRVERIVADLDMPALGYVLRASTSRGSSLSEARA